jgi:mannosyl-3-phosphoglycerate phosphatase
MTRFVVFTDLDGTLLDHHTYAYTEALPALSKLRRTQTPLIMVSSKTRREIETIRSELGNEHPFIPENGGAVFVPKGYDLPLPDEAVATGDYHVLVLGRRNAELAAAFDQLARVLPVRALSRLSGKEVVDLTGLSMAQAEAAQEREFGEAFLVDDPEIKESMLRDAVRKLGLRLTRGGRFWHLLGENDKGRAVTLLSSLFRRRNPEIVTVGCGDAPNDEPMLAAVDRPFLVARSEGGHRPIDIPHLTRTQLPGPAGFNQAVLSLWGG